MYQVVPNTTTIPTSAGTWTQPSYSPYTSSITTTTRPIYEMDENEVNIEKVDNGFIINTKSSTFVAQNMLQLTEVLTKFFEEKKSE
jgi:hypothetical protein